MKPHKCQRNAWNCFGVYCLIAEFARWITSPICEILLLTGSIMVSNVAFWLSRLFLPFAHRHFNRYSFLSSFMGFINCRCKVYIVKQPDGHLNESNAGMGLCSFSTQCLPGLFISTTNLIWIKSSWFRRTNMPPIYRTAFTPPHQRQL